ncbi:MAG: hypothetical protein PWP70_1846 [Moorella sp. (in: firmicutes)]|nr:hypothetical protein [Moorella sp. (in: firmicutes)]
MFTGTLIGKFCVRDVNPSGREYFYRDITLGPGISYR